MAISHRFLVVDSDSSQKYDQLDSWGPKFTRLALLYQKPDPTNDDDEDDNT